MPLIQGKSNASRSKNIATEIKSGRKPAQAAAIAYSTQRAAKAKGDGRLLPAKGALPPPMPKADGKSSQMSWAKSMQAKAQGRLAIGKK